MKYAMMFLIAAFSVSAFADCNTQTSAEEATEQLVIKTDVPKHLQGATICVRLATGKESCAPAEKFKVVPRMQQFIVTKTERSQVTTCQNDPRRNRVTLNVGNGPKEGLSRDNSEAPNKVTVESRTGAVGGIQYQYLTPWFNNRLSVGGQLMTNETGLLGAGYEF